jgi:protease I
LNALIVAAPGVQDVEFVYPYYRLQEAGFRVTVSAPVEPGPKAFQGIGGLWLPANLGLPITYKGMAPEYKPDVLVLPGGVKAMEKLRQEERLLTFIREVHAAGKVIASMCSGAQLLISAGIVNGRTISAYPAMRVDVENAGATWFPGVYADENIVTAPHYDLLGSWMAVVLGVARDQRLWREGAACAAAL